MGLRRVGGRVSDVNDSMCAEFKLFPRRIAQLVDWMLPVAPDYGLWTVDCRDVLVKAQINRGSGK